MRAIDIGFFSVVGMLLFNVIDYRYALVMLASFIVGMMLAPERGYHSIAYINAYKARIFVIAVLAVLGSSRSLYIAMRMSCILLVCNFLVDYVIKKFTKMLGNINITVLVTFGLALSACRTDSAFTYIIVGSVFGYFMIMLDRLVEDYKGLSRG